jgi:hypothetical protein
LRTATTGEIAIGRSNFDRGMTRGIFKSAGRDGALRRPVIAAR